MALPGAPAVPLAGARDPTRERPPERAYWAVLADGAASRAMDVLASGGVLAALAVALGASGATLGLLLAALPALGQLGQLPATWWIRRTGNAKAVCLALVLPARLLLLAIAVLAFTAPATAGSVLVPAIAAYTLLANASGAGWGVWMNELLPRERLGRFYAARLALMALAGLAALGASAWYLRDAAGAARPLAIVFAAGALAGLAGALFIAAIPERRHVPAPGSTLNPIAALRRSPEYARALPGLVALSTGLHLFLPFGVAVLLLAGAHSESTALLLVAWSQVVALAAFPALGKLSDGIGTAPGAAGLAGAIARPLRGHARVAAFGALTLAAAALAWALAAQAGYPLRALVAIYALHGLGTAAVDLAVGNLQMTLAPRGEAPALFAGTAILRALASALAGALAGAWLAASAAGDPRVWLGAALLTAASAWPLARAARAGRASPGAAHESAGLGRGTPRGAGEPGAP